MPNPAQKTQVTVKDYLLIIFLRKKFFLLPFLIVFFTASIGSFFMPKYYRSAVMVKVEDKKPVNPLAVPERRGTTDEDKTLVEKMRTLTEEILSYHRLIFLINELNLRESLGSISTTTESLITALRKSIKVKMISPEIFLVSYEDKDPQQAKDVVNRLVGIFIDEQIKQKEEEAMAGVEYAESEAELYKEELEKAEEKFKKYREKHALQLPGRELDMNVDILVSYELQLTSLRMDQKNLQEEINKIKRQLSGREAVIISDDMLDLNPIVIELNRDLQELRLAIDNLLLSDPESEKIYELQQALEDTRRRLQEEIEKTVNAETIVSDPLFYQRLSQRFKGADQRMNELKDRESELTRLKEMYEKRIKTLPAQEAEYSRLGRDVELNSQLYRSLRIKAEEGRLTAEELKKIGINYELIEEGRLPLKASKPKKLLITVVSLLLGVMSGFGCVFLAEFSDRSFKSTEDAIGYMEIPCLGSVSKIMTRGELASRRRRERSAAILIVCLAVILITAGIVSTYKENEEVRLKIAEQEKLEEAD